MAAEGTRAQHFARVQLVDAAGWAKLKDWFGEAIDATPERAREILAGAERESPELAAELRGLLRQHSESVLDTRAMMPPSAAPPTPPIIEAHPADGPPGGTIGPYRVIREIGRGGTGLVFLSERSDDEFHRAVALKVLRYIAWDAPSRALLTQERRMLAQLQHPHIAQLVDWGETPEGAPWLAMEYVEGVPIDEYCRSKHLDVNATLSVFEQVCDAVQYAHRRLVVHRDLKPGNILVTPAGVVKLLDFGISKLLDDETATRTMDRRFTPAFASPEQLRGEPVTATSDVYALGLILYDLIAGSVPFSGGSVDDVVRRLSDQEWPPPSSAPARAGIDRRRIAGDLDRIVLHALARQPERRYQSVEQMLADIGRFREGYPISAQPPTFAYRARKFLRRNALPVALGATAAIAMAAGTVFSVWSARVARQEQQNATRRFDAVRQLARSVLFDMYDEIRGIPGSVKARQMLVTTAVKYLDDLNAESTNQSALRNDDTLQMELAAGYIRMAYIQGGVAGVNLGDTAGSIKSYRTVLRILDEQWHRRPDDPQVGALRFPAAYNLSMMINDPKEGVLFARPYSIEADAWQERDSHSGPMQTSYLLHIALGRMLRMAGAHDESLRELAFAEDMRSRMMPLAYRDNTPRPMFGISVDYAQGLFDGGLIAYGRTETLVDMGRNEDALTSVTSARELFALGMKQGRFGPSDRRMQARVRSLQAFVLLKLGRLDEALSESREGLRLADANIADGSGTAVRDLAEAHWRAGSILTAHGERAGGLDHFKAAAYVITPLTGRDKVLLFDKVLLTQILNDYGDALRAAQQDAAAGVFRRALELATAALAETPNWPQIRHERDRAARSQGDGTNVPDWF